MNKKNIQNEKLIVEELPENYLPRQNLAHLFKQAEHKRILFLKAPGGYGKTSSAVHWLKQTNEEPLWVSLDEYDNLPALFYKVCCSALLVAQPHNQSLATIVNDPEFASSPVEYTLLALTAFATNERAYTLVLDDFHLITNPKILKSLPFILKRMALSTKIILLSREELPAEVATHYGEEKIARIEAKDLAFSEAEVSAFYQSLGKHPSKEDSQRIYNQTDGWPIAVQTVAMSNNVPTAPKGEQNTLSLFIEKQIWEKWTPEKQVFFMKLSVLDEITPELSQLVTGHLDSLELVKEVAAENMLIRKITTETYRFHDLFADFLQTKLKQHSEISITKLYEQLATYYIEKHDIFKARHAAINSQNEGLMVASLLNDARYQNFKTSIEEYVDTVLKYQATNIPDSLYKREPVFHMIPAWYYYLTGDSQKMAVHLDQLLVNFAQIAATAPSFIEEIVLICGLDTRQTLLEKINIISQFISLPKLEAPLEQTKNISLTLQLPFLHRGLIDYYELTNQAEFATVAPHFKVLLKETFEQTMTTVYGGLAIETNDLQLAYQLTCQAYAQITKDTNDEFYFSQSMQLLHLHHLMGSHSEFKLLQKQLTTWITTENNFYLLPNLKAYEARLAIWDGNSADAQLWLDSYYVTSNTEIELYKVYQHLTTIRAYLLVNRKHDALILGERLLTYFKDFHRLTDEAETTVLVAIIYWSLGNHKQAIDLLAAILVKTTPYKLIRVYADEGAALLPLLTKLRNRLNQLSETTEAEQLYLATILLATKAVASRAKGILPAVTLEQVKLSKQQLLMIQLLAEGHKFSDMVKLTNLSINTIRAHVSLAYQKLQVNNANDAVLKAKKLKLL